MVRRDVPGPARGRCRGSTPTLLFFDQHGALAYRIEGYLPPREFSTGLDAAIRRSRKAVSAAGVTRAFDQMSSGSYARERVDLWD